MDDTPQRSYTITKLWSRHKEILRLIASGLYSQKQVAEIVGTDPQTINNVVNCALGKQTLEMLHGAADAETVDLLARYKVLAPIMLTLQTEMAMEEGTSKPLKNAIANRIQDRAGYAPVAKNLNVNLNRVMSREDLEGIKARVRQLRQVGVGEGT